MKLTKSLMPEGASVQCKGFLFDLDGTLVDSLPAVERAWCNWADRFGLDHAEVLGFIHGKQAITSLRHFMVGKSEAEIAAEFYPSGADRSDGNRRDHRAAGGS